MQALDLHIEDRVRVDDLPGRLAQVVGEGNLVVVLDFGETGEHALIVFKLAEVFETSRLVTISVADAVLDEGGKLRIGIAEPAAVRNAVGHIGETVGVHLVEVLEDRVHENLGVDLRHAVNGMRADDCQICHADSAARQDGNAGDLVPVGGEVLPCFLAEALVDFFNNHVHARQRQREELLVPGLQRFGQDGVVGVGHRVDHRVPCILPRIVVVIQQDAHQLGNAERGMRVVDVDGNLVGEICQRAVHREVVAEDALYRRTDEEVLLLQAQQLALGVVVGGVEHLGDGLRLRALRQRLGILPLREQRHVEVGDVARTPQPQTADRIAVRARDHHVVGDSLNLFAVLVADVAVPLRPLLHDLPAKADAEGAVGAGNQPDLAAGQPDVGQLDLQAVDDLLLEETVLIADGKAGCRVVERRQRVHKAGGKSAETAVAETRVRLELIKVVDVEAEVLQRQAVFVHHAEVAEVGLERSAQQKLHAHIVHTLGAGLVDLLLEELALFGERVLDGHGSCLVHLLRGRFLRRAAEVTR